MAVYSCRAKITNSKYTVSIPPFEVKASRWSVAAYRASERALINYKIVRGRRDRPIEIEVTVSQKQLKHIPEDPHE